LRGGSAAATGAASQLASRFTRFSALAGAAAGTGNDSRFTPRPMRIGSVARSQTRIPH
jgi:hypothetical protein